MWVQTYNHAKIVFVIQCLDIEVVSTKVLYHSKLETGSITEPLLNQLTSVVTCGY